MLCSEKYSLDFYHSMYHFIMLINLVRVIAIRVISGKDMRRL